MQINYLSPDYSVAPQIAVADVATIAEAGFKSVICNRPDQENPETHQIAAIKAEVIAAGLEFAENVFDPSTFGSDKIQRQSELLQELPSPVLAYCASGTRCSYCMGLRTCEQHGHRQHFNRNDQCRLSIVTSAATARVYSS